MLGIALAMATLTAATACSDTKSAGTNDATGTRDSVTGAAGAALSQSTGGEAAAPSARRVVILGTSLTAGLGLDPDDAYPAVLQRMADSAKLGARIVNAGLSGETSAGALRRAAWVLDQPAALVVLEVGANDGLRGVDPDSTYANLVRLIDTVRTKQPAAAIALVQMEAPTNLGRSYTTRFHEAYGKAAMAKGVTLWPFLLDGVAGVAALNQGDGIHPNKTGALKVGATLWTPLKDALGVPRAP